MRVRAAVVALMVLAGLLVAVPAQAAEPCWTGSTSRVLKITAPGWYNGCGKTVPGIEITASDVTVENFVVRGASSTGIWAQGKRVVIQDNTITQVYYRGDDVDAIRFFGDGTKILRNHVYDLTANDPQDSHVDCMQTWASKSKGPSSNVIIQGNRCEGTEIHQCVMAEGPRSTGGGGGARGDSRTWLIDGNQFECYANQSISLRDINDVRISYNNFTGAGRKAVQLADGSNATFEGNILGPGIRTLYGD